MVQIKVCGLTREADIQLCVHLGVDRLGFVLAPSPRQLSLAQLDQLLPLLPPGQCWSAVLVDPPTTLVEELLSRGCPSLQFHGQETADFCQRFQGRARLTKALRISQPAHLEECFPVDEYLLDGARPGQGEPFDWNWLSQRRPDKPFFLAGGLHADNVAQAIRQLSPLGVDVSSGVEERPGHKDEAKLRRFVSQARTCG